MCSTDCCQGCQPRSLQARGAAEVATTGLVPLSRAKFTRKAEKNRKKIKTKLPA